MTKGDEHVQKKQLTILQYLLNHKNKRVTAAEIASVLNVSVRTVKSYIQQINTAANAKVIQSSNQGYMVNRYLANTIISKTEIPIPQSYDERCFYILRQFLLEHVDYIEVYELCDSIYISDSTLKADIARFKNDYQRYQLELLIEKDHLLLIGSEKNKRRVMGRMIYEKVGTDFIDIGILKTEFSSFDVEAIGTIVKSISTKYNNYINDVALVNIILHITIIIDRLLEGNYVNDSIKGVIKSEKDRKIIDDLSNMLQRQFHIQFSQEEKYEIHILYKANANITTSSNVNEMKEYVGEDILDLASQLIELIYEQYNINLSNTAFIIPFCMHLKGLFVRIQNDAQVKNPMLDIIKQSNPVIYDIAVFTSLQLIRLLEIEINENEVAFLALHIGGEIERQKINNNKISAVLLCPNYLNIETKLYNDILMSFNRDIDIIATVSDSSAFELLSFDLLITTVNLPKTSKYDVVTVSPFINEIEKLNVRNKIEDIKRVKKNRVLKQNFFYCFSEELFFVTDDVGDKGDAISLLATAMKQLDYVNDDFEEKVLERENASSTGFMNVAIPHSMEMNAKKTSIGVLISKEGINWNKQIVHVVLMIAINRSDFRMFRELYEALVVLFSDTEYISMCRKCKTFDDFKHLIYTMIS